MSSQTFSETGPRADQQVGDNGEKYVMREGEVFQFFIVVSFYKEGGRWVGGGRDSLGLDGLFIVLRRYGTTHTLCMYVNVY